MREIWALSVYDVENVMSKWPVIPPILRLCQFTTVCNGLGLYSLRMRHPKRFWFCFLTAEKKHSLFDFGHRQQLFRLSTRNLMLYVWIMYGKYMVKPETPCRREAMQCTLFRHRPNAHRNDTEWTAIRSHKHGAITSTKPVSLTGRTRKTETRW